MADRFKIAPVTLRMDRCGNCRYFAEAIPNEMPPTCRIQGAPNMVGVPSGIQGQMGFIGVWPPIKPEYWCPKWEALNERDHQNRASLANNV